MMARLTLLACAFLVLLCPSASGVTNLLTNPEFNDTDGNGLGTDWTRSGDVYFFSFFGDNAHASLFADTIFHEGRLEQTGIPGIPGTTYQFDAFNMRVEANFSPHLRIGLEYYDGLDNKIGETKETVDYATRRIAAGNANPPQLDGGGAMNGINFSIQGTAVPGTVTVRPVLEYDSVVTGGNQANAFLFSAHMSVVPGLGDEALKNSGFEDTDGSGFFGDYWASFGAAGFGNLFAGEGPANGHASLFANTAGNFGGIYQKSILGTAGTEYEFSLNDVRVEANIDGDFRFGLEYYADDDITKLGESIVALDTSVVGDGLTFSMNGTAVAGTKYVRPIVLFDNVLTTAPTQGNLFVFDASLSEVDPTAVENADFDGDGDVDGRDFLIWQRGFGMGTSLSQGDANDDSVVDEADLLIWQAQYGMPIGPLVSNVTTVPEPSALLLTAGIFGGTVATRRRFTAKSKMYHPIGDSP